MNVVEKLAFVPDEDMRKVKAAFWAKASEKPYVNPDELTLVVVTHEVPDSRLKEWWHLDGFRAWFSNKDESRQRMEYLFNSGLDAIEDLLAARNEKLAGAQVKAIEMLARLLNKEPPKVKEVKMLDKEVQDMDQVELEEFIRKNSKLLKQGQDEEEANKASQN